MLFYWFDSLLLIKCHLLEIKWHLLKIKWHLFSKSRHLFEIGCQDVKNISNCIACQNILLIDVDVELMLNAE